MKSRKNLRLLSRALLDFKSVLNEAVMALQKHQFSLGKTIQ